MQYPDYNNSIVNLACSVMKHFGVTDVENGTLPLADRFLQKNYKNVVVILLDALGACILQRNLEPEGFFNSHRAGVFSSVFPPTTTAATTSMDNGLYPAQHGWLGWDCYFPQIDQNVTLYRNVISGTEKTAAEYDVAWQYCPYESVVQRIRRAGREAYYVTPFLEPYPESFPAVCDEVARLCHQEGRKYIYAYWTEPDSTMHKTGCYSEDSKEIVRTLERQVQELCQGLTDTLVFVTADHGHMDSGNYWIEEYPGIVECLVRQPSIEPRALNLFVKPGMEPQLKLEFAKAFGDQFLLLDKEAVLEQGIFGSQANRERIDGMLGDYLAIAVGSASLFCTREETEKFVGAHAGMTEDEMQIPLVVIERE